MSRRATTVRVYQTVRVPILSLTDTNIYMLNNILRTSV